MELSARAARFFPAARSRDYRWLWGASIGSSIAHWTLVLGNAWVVHQLSDSAALVGVATFATMFPLFLSPVGGLVADRFERRSMLVTARASAAVTIGVLFLLAVFDLITVGAVVALAFVQGVVRAAEHPAEQALLPNVVPATDMGNAITLHQATRLGSRAVGPLLAGPLLATVGVAGAYGIAAVFMFVGCLGASRIETVSRGGVESLRRAAGSLRDGWAAVRGNAPVFSIFLVVVAHCSLTMSFDAVLPAMADHHLHRPTHGLTILIVSLGFGAFLGTFALALFNGAYRGPFFFATALVSGLGPVALALSPSVPMAAISIFAMGASQAMFMALAAVFLQELVDDAVRGRVMSLYLMSAGGIMAFANLGYGSVADFIGAPATLLVPGLLFVALVALSFAAAPWLRVIFTRGDVEEAASVANPAG